MKLVRLTLTAVFAVFMLPVLGFCAEKIHCTDTNVEKEHQHLSCHSPICPKAGPAGRCKDPACNICNGSHRAVCPQHGENCRNGCLKNEYSYGRMEVCPGKTNGVCPVHGYGQCPHPNQAVGPFLRQAFAPADRPYFGAQPLYVPREQYDPGFQPRFPRLRSLFVMPVAPEARYMTTTPPEQMNTYTTRGPRDFLMPNPPSIGY